jgi:Flp pilus assembly protein TadG
MGNSLKNIRFWRTWLADLLQSNRGAVAVETAVVMPVLVLVVLGTIEVCSMIFLQQSLEIAAYEGARAALVPKSKAGNVTFTTNQLLTARNVSSAAVSVTPANFDTLPYGTIITVSASAPCNANSVVPPMFFSGMTLTGNVEMMKEF